MLSRIFENSSVSILYDAKSRSATKCPVLLVDSKNVLIEMYSFSPILQVFNGARILVGYCWWETIIYSFFAASALSSFSPHRY
jgi:hypothetical protein